MTDTGPYAEKLCERRTMTAYEWDCFSIHLARAIADALETRRVIAGRVQKVAIIQCEILDAIREWRLDETTSVASKGD